MAGSGYTRARYVGPVKALAQLTALTTPHPETADCVLAQFDDIELAYRVAYGWHRFPARDFEPLEDASHES